MRGRASDQQNLQEVAVPNRKSEGKVPSRMVLGSVVVVSKASSSHDEVVQSVMMIVQRHLKAIKVPGVVVGTAARERGVSQD